MLLQARTGTSLPPLFIGDTIVIETLKDGNGQDYVELDLTKRMEFKDRLLKSAGMA